MPSHRRPTPAGRTAAARVSLLSLAATAAVAVGMAPAAGEPAGPSAASDRVDQLYAAAERAVEEYNGAAERVDALEETVEEYQDRIARGQQQLNEQRHALGSAAAAEYRTGGIDPSLALLLSADPDGFLDRAATVDRAGSRQAGELRELLVTSRTLEQQRAEASDALAELTDEKAALAERKQAAQEQLAAAEDQLRRLTDQERAEREERERAARDATRAATPDEDPEPTAGDGAGAASGRAGSALDAARQVLGTPYVWGQNSPGGFDCSGLTQWAWAQAGVALPRTSQEQANAGRTVTLAEAQPGDLVVYRDDASHIGLYAGDGQVIHSPYPGASVRYEPVGMMPISAVVRP